MNSDTMYPITVGEWLVRRSTFFKKLRLLKQTGKQIFHGRMPIFLDFIVDPQSRYGYGKPPHAELYSLLDANRATYNAHLTEFQSLVEQARKIPLSPSPNEPTAPHWENLLFTGLDALSLYSMVAIQKPKQYLEVGSGHSTTFTKRAIKDFGLSTQVTAIDPSPRREIKTIVDKLIPTPLEETDLNVFKDLKSGDMLLIDNSHHLFMNSDATVFFLDILPKLAKGVWVCVHDIFLPYDYPPHWKGFYYGEQYCLATYLLGGAKGIEVHCPNQFIVRDKELASILNPFFDAAGISKIPKEENAFWFKTV